MANDNTSAFVFYESFLKGIQRVEGFEGKEAAYDFLMDLIEYGLYGLIPEENNKTWLYGFEQMKASIDNAQNRREKQIAQGKMGDPQLATEFLDAILAYGFTGEMPDKDSIVWNFGLATIFSTIDASTTRYEKAIKNGGGRPSVSITIEDIYEQIETCDTWKEIAANLKIDADTLRAIRQKYGLAERNPRKYRGTELPKTEKPQHDSFSVLSANVQESGKETSQKTQNRKTEKLNLEKPNTSVLGNTEVFRSFIKTTTKNETKNRKTEKPKNQTEKPKNLNDNVNYNYNYNNLQLPAEAKDDSVKSIRTKTEKPKNLVEKEKPNDIRFFSDTIIKTEKPKNYNTDFSDNSKQKDDNKNEPMTEDQKQWLRDKGYNY